MHWHQRMEPKIWVILVVMLLCFKWSGQADMDRELPSTIPTDVSVSAPIPEKVINVANAVNNFGYKLLLKMMNERKNDNIVISPTGVAGLLAMTLLGSVGRTYDEIAEVIGFSQDIFANRKNHEQLGELLLSLNSANVSSKTLYADAAFVDVQTPLRELYRNYLHNVYRGEILGTDFKQSEDAKHQINEWVKNHTEGRIEKFLKRSLPTSTKLVLLSAIYFSSQWEQPFIPEYTTKMPFKNPTHEIMADLMLTFGRFPYTISTKHDFIMIALPYNDNETSMYALKPRLPKKMSLLEVMEKLDYEKIEEAISEMTNKKCIVRLPKMELQSRINLENTLKSIGIHDMFTPGAANFALMVNGNNIVNRTEEELIIRIENDRSETESRGVKEMLNSLPNPGIHVDSVIHDVKMSINELGTEAVAATSAILARTAELFYANSPFYIFIRNNKTKLVTFSAVIFDPTV